MPPSQPSQQNTLTPSLNVNQMMQNIDVMKAQKVADPQIQDYVNNYQKGTDGNYTLKSSPAANGGGYINDVENSEKSQFNEAEQAQQNSNEGTENPLAAGATEAKDASGMVVAPVVEAVKPILDKTINPIIKSIADKIGNTAPVQEFTNMMSKYPELSGALSDAIQGGLNISGMAGGEEAAPEVANKVGDAAAGVSDAAANTIEGAGKAVGAVKNAASDAATPLDARIQTMIENVKPEDAPAMADTLKQYMDQARTATKTNEATPYETAGTNQLTKALRALKSPNPATPGLLDTAGKTMESEMENSGNKQVPINDAETALNQMMQDRLGSIHETAFQPSKFNSLQESMDYINNLEKNTKGLNGMGDEEPSGNIYNAPGRTSRIQTTADRGLVDAAYNTLDRLKNGGATPKQVEDEISNLNTKIANSQGTGVTPIKSPVQGVVSQFVNSLNGSLKDTVGDTYGKARDTYAQLRPMYDELSNKLGENNKNAASIAKQAFSPVSGTRNLLQRVEEATGVPIFNHLNMAKFAMETAHDPRVASLLEQGEKGLKGIGSVTANPATWINLVRNLLSDPEGKATRLLEQKGK